VVPRISLEIVSCAGLRHSVVIGRTPFDVEYIGNGYV